MAEVNDAFIQPGARIGDYLLQTLAGRGASSRVFKARHEPSGELRALKIFDVPTLAPTADDLRHMASLRHPDIVETLEQGHDQGMAWLAQTWAPGHDLSRYVNPRLLLPEPIVISIGWRLAGALDLAHRLGITHRDIKPANVRLHLPTGELKLMDFGIAKAADHSSTMTGVLKGTPAYMAPEILRGDPADALTDLYALGVLLYELSSGRRPHEADTLGQLLQHLTSKPATPLREHRPDATPALEALLARVLSARRAQRPPSAAEFARELRALGGDRPSPPP